MREFLIAGNWKMNGSMVANKQLVAGIIDGQPLAGFAFCSAKLTDPSPLLGREGLADGGDQEKKKQFGLQAVINCLHFAVYNYSEG